MLNVPRCYPLLFTVFLLSLLVGCSSGPRMQETIVPAPSSDQALSIERVMILANARQALGTPYRYGGASSNGVDCSGLVQMAYGAAGISVPRTADQQFSRLPSRERARPGDLLFFGSGNTATHVGIYLGRQQMIHAPGAGREVTTTSLALDYWRNRFLGAAGPAP
ncbi:C40 family peptidase [Halomonas sp. McH1-25]|uniref:C40 family peptidase n=1 Tax=unclassified Halomonas TaxID=2609666 RepID=UPI001EF6A5B7|nr:MULTISPECIES: C40 family peptidase [unclassified Halomonas]MCG7599935.1 C40 family peptidase [Halomonas sp. McH1-25]MCP1342626.1 C40 family peptidase [Halomonas sp. FL8]MCP1361341.1 C40 family peptidase [Halomonas sp. BBD45]MCP1364667.1 C40 family peptidase [Halomonas sp. BBD48]